MSMVLVDSKLARGLNAPNPQGSALPVSRKDAERRGTRSSVRTVSLAALALLLMYAALCLLDDPRGTLGTDTGGKLATLHSMESRGSLEPDIGYWAARYDPRGHLHPLYYTVHVGDHWVNVTTLPMLYLAYPLYRLGGERAVLILPMLGAVLAALAARALAERMRVGSGWWAFWAIGLATPIALYALDFWEHAPGVAAVLWGIVFVIDVIERRAGWRGALAAGALFGLAATMRTEALVYALVATAVMCALHRKRGGTTRSACGLGAVTTLGLAVPLLANQVLEHLILGTGLRAGRAAGTVHNAAGGVGRRVEEALQTTVGLDRFPGSADWQLGAAIVAIVVVAAFVLTRQDGRKPLVVALAVVAMASVYALRFSDGLGFVPGLLTASPLAVAGLAVAWRAAPNRTLVCVALAALPLVWATEFSGGATAQWGGRYVLVSGALLAIAGVVVLSSWGRVATAILIAASVGVTATGIAWLSTRSHTAADAMEQIVARHDDVLVSDVQHVLREGGAFYEPDRHWLTATSPHETRGAFEVARRSGAHEVGLIQLDAGNRRRAFGDFVRSADVQHLEFVPGVPLVITTYRR
jgi:hypothetical protein